MGRERTIRPLGLRHTAAAVARNYGDKGAVIISVGDDGTRIGVENLTPEELREALCTVIHYSFVFEVEADSSDDVTSS